MPYVYPQIRAPFAGSLADTILRQGDIAANAASQIGAIQAGAAARQGQIWGSAVNNIGQDVSNTIRYETDPRVQEEREQLAQRHAMVQGQAAVNHIVSTLTTQNADGSRTLDRAKLSQQMAAQNIPLLVQQQTFKALDDVDASIKTFNTARVDHMADLAHGILSAPGGATPQNVLTAAALAKANGLATDDQLTPIIGAATSGKDLTPMLTQMRSMSEKYKNLTAPVKLAGAARPGAAPETLVDPGSGRVLATGAAAGEAPPTEASIALSAAGGDPSKAMDLLKPKPTPSKEPRPVLLDGKPAILMFDPKTATYSDASGTPIADPASHIKPMTDPNAAMAAAVDRQTREIAAASARQAQSELSTKQNQGRSELTNKVEQPYNDATEKADTLRNVVKAAQGGNMVAGSLQPLLAVLGVTTMEGVKRINNTEISQVAGAGSLLDKIQGKVGKLVVGQPMDSALQKDIIDLADLLQKSAYQKYSTEHQRVKTRYSLDDEVPIAPPKAPPTGTVQNGATWKYGAQGWGWYQ